MRFGQKVPQVEYIPLFNTGCMFDIPTGSYFIGEYGQSILSGGLGDVNSITGIGNSFKSTLAECIKLAIVDKLIQTDDITFDSENVLGYGRKQELASRYKSFKGHDLTNPHDQLRERFTITSMSSIDENGKIQYGDRFHDKVSKYAREIHENKKNVYYTTPFSIGGNFVKLRLPTIISYDSFSKMKFSSIEEGKVKDNKVGDTELNTLNLDEGRFKTQINNTMPGLARLGELRFIMTAHTQKETKIGGKFDADKQKLTYGKHGYDIKGCGTAFIQINEIILDIQSCKKFNNDTVNTGVKYPLVESDRSEHCTDLNLLTVMIARNKNGGTGTILKFIVSQREGLLQHLSMFLSLIDNKFGFNAKGNTQTLSLLPEVTVQRTTVRGIIDNSHKVQRALEFTSMLLQMYYLFTPEANKYWCTPEELYTDIKTLGYDWDFILENTREHWVFKEEDNNNLPQLTIMDLLRMRAGVYTPYWLNEKYIKQAKGLLKETLDKIPKEQWRK
jgi:hypothetical protein